MCFKSYWNNVQLDREVARRVYIEIVQKMNEDMNTFKYNTWAFKQASHYYDAYMARLFRYRGLACKSISRTRIKNIIEAMELIHDRWAAFYHVLLLY